MRLAVILAAVSALLFAAQPAAAQPAPQGEQLYLIPPLGWVPAYHTVQGNVELVEMVPQGESSRDWTQMLTVQLVKGAPDRSPEQVLKSQFDDIRQDCDDVAAGKMAAMHENNYDSAIQVMACTKSKQYGKGEITLFKVIRGQERLYVISRAWRGAPFDKAHLPLPKATGQEWLTFMQRAVVCNSRGLEHPCPRPQK